MSEIYGWDERNITSAANRTTLQPISPTLHDAPGMSILSTAGSPVRTYQSPGRGPVLPVIAAVSGLSSTGSCPNCGHDGSALRMSLDFYPRTAEQISPSSSAGWMTSGSMQRGRYWTRSTSESRNAAGACSLSAVLEAEVPSKFYLSAKAAAGILRRAERRGKTLLEPLVAALESVAGAPTQTE